MWRQASARPPLRPLPSMRIRRVGQGPPLRRPNASRSASGNASAKKKNSPDPKNSAPKSPATSPPPTNSFPASAASAPCVYLPWQETPRFPRPATKPPGSRHPLACLPQVGAARRHPLSANRHHVPVFLVWEHDIEDPGSSRNIAPQNILKVSTGLYGVFPFALTGFLLAPIKETNGLSVAAVLASLNWHDERESSNGFSRRRKSGNHFSVPGVTCGSFRHISNAR